MTQTVRSILIVLSFPIGLGLIFFVFRLLSRAFVTGVAPSGPISRQGKKQRKLGDYTILSELGRGGMGTVFKAVGQQGRTVAIKVIGGMHTDRRAGARGTNRVGLVHEARLAASLRHPNIVSIFDVRREKHTLYVVMEYLEGTPLSLYIRQRRPSVPEALRIIAEVCDALKYAHARGIIHRDIKPANIFITTNNTVKILDFGLAVRGDYRAGFGGTPPYMSPEQLTGTELDARTDIWSAGVTLFEVLTGRCPFAAENLFALRAKITDGRLPELPPELPCVPNLQTILGKALAKDREARYTAASQFGMELRSLILEIERGYPKAPLSVLIPNLPDRPLAGSVANASERSLVNLGFREQVNTKVVLIKSPQRLWFDAYNISSLRAWGNIIQTAGSSLVMLGLSVAFAMHQFWRPALESQVVFFVILAALWVLIMLFGALQLILETISPPHVLRCRSCGRKMRTASDWRRFVWSVDKEGYCVNDCLAALMQDHWEDAVTLFLLHTTWERTDIRYRLMFLECKFCHDQRAYFWFSPVPSETPEVKSGAYWSEAYKFFDPLKAAEFARAAKPVTQRPASDFSGQKTI